MNKLIEKIKQIIQRISGTSKQQEEEHIKNIILEDISDVEPQDIEPEGERVINIKNKQFGTNNVVKEMTKEDEEEILKRIFEMKQNMQNRNISKSPEQFRKSYSYEIKEGTKIKDGDVTINFGKGIVIGDGNVMINYEDER